MRSKLNNNKDDSHQEDDSSEQIIGIDETELDISDTSSQLDNLNNNDESNVVIEEEEDILQERAIRLRRQSADAFKLMDDVKKLQRLVQRFN